MFNSVAVQKWQGMLGYYYSVNLLAMGKMQAGHASTAAYYLSRNKWVHLSLVVLGGKGAYLGINGGELHGLQTQNGWALGQCIRERQRARGTEQGMDREKGRERERERKRERKRERSQYDGETCWQHPCRP